MSRCGYFNQLDLHQVSNSSNNNNISDYDLKIGNFPGGPDTFESVLKFCYGLPIDLTPVNVASLRCASDFLDMTDDFEDGNLISKTEHFLSFILSSWKNSIAVLRSCEPLSPWADNLHIVRRCCDTIAWKASRDQFVKSPKSHVGDQWWFKDVSLLRIDHFVRVVIAVRVRGVAPETVGGLITYYAERWLGGFDNEMGCDGHGKEIQLRIMTGRRDEEENKERRRRMIESLVSILPQERDAVSCGFMVWMLKMGMLYGAAPALVSELEKRVGMVLEDANVNDLLIPNYNTFGDPRLLMSSMAVMESTMHDVDVVQRVVEYFLMHEEQQEIQQVQPEKCGKLKLVGKLLDGFLAEIAKDPNLSTTTFQQLSELLPPNARACHDGIYRAIDTYLKAHPSLMDHDRRRLCRVMDCEKLSLDACMHAAQNERLPLRTAIQVLFTEQVKMRAAIQGRDQPVAVKRENIEEQESIISSATKDIKILRTELEGVKIKLTEMQRDYLELQLEFEKLIKQKSSGATGWSSGWKKFKNSTFFHIKTENEDSSEAPQTHSQRYRSRRVSIS